MSTERKNATFTVKSCAWSDATGNSLITLIATAVHHNNTHKKFINPDHITANLGFIDHVYTTVATAFAVSWNQFINSNAKTNKQSKTITNSDATIMKSF